MMKSNLMAMVAGMSLAMSFAPAPAAAAVAAADALIIPQKTDQNAGFMFAQKSKPKPVPAAIQAPPQGQIQMPAPEAMIIMIRSSLVALSQANVTGNYSVLNQLGSPEFRQSNSPDRLSQVFASFRTNNIDLAPVVFVTPQLSQTPRIENGKLRMIGNFPTQPMRVDFDLQFEPSGGIWKLYGIAVNLTPAPTIAQSAPQRQFVPGQGR